MLNALVTLAAEEGETPNPLLPAWYDIVWSLVCFIVILIIFSSSSFVFVLSFTL